MSGAHRDGDGAIAETTEWIIDLTNRGSVARAAQLAVDELQAVLGGGPWCITARGTGEVLAASGALGPRAERVLPLPAPGLDLVAVECSTREHDADHVRDTIDRIGRLLSAVVEAEARAEAATRRAKAAEALAAVDALTGVLDQGEWWRRLEETEARLRRNPRDVAIVVVDLDGLKVVNDVEGHLAGDALIRRAADILTGIVRTGDLVARVGGDEFAILAVDHDATADVLAERVADALWAGGVPASVGGRAHRPGSSLRTTFAGADHAMYEDKRRRAEWARGDRG